MSDLHGTVHWTELMTRDVAKAKAYYAKVCGWEFDEVPMEEGIYHVARVGETMVAGIMDLADMPGMEAATAYWMTYLAVDDVDAVAKETAAMGGAIHRAPWDVEGVGRVAMISDPAGAALGIMTPS